MDTFNGFSPLSGPADTADFGGGLWIRRFNFGTPAHHNTLPQQKSSSDVYTHHYILIYISIYIYICIHLFIHLFR